MLVASAHTETGFDPSSAIAPQIHVTLRGRIIRNELRADQKISESEIAIAFGVSRQPVREAFIRLATEDLVVIRPQRGTLVRRIDPTAVHEARFLREAIEADIARILAARPGPDTLDRLRAELTRQAAIADDDRRGFLRADEDFHRIMAECAGHGGAWSRILGLRAQMDRVRFLSLGSLAKRNLATQHAHIVDAIATGDAARAETALRTHLREVLCDLPQIVAANPDVFDAPQGATLRDLTTRGGETP